MKFFSFSKREQVIIYIFAAVVAMYTVYTFVYTPFQIRAASIDSQIALMEKKLNKAYDMMQVNQGMDERVRQQFEYMFLRRAPEEEMSSLLAELEAIASKADIQISDMKPQQVRLQERAYIFSVKLALNHDLKTLLKFVTMLQDEPYFLTIDEFSFERASSVKDGLRCVLFVSRLRLRPL